MGQELKIEFVEHSMLIISPSALDYAPKFSCQSAFFSSLLEYSGLARK